MSQHFTFRDQSISVGDTVRVNQQITEGGKTRTQAFEGIVIAVKNRGTGQTFTVRRVGAASIGIEKIFPVSLPTIQNVEVTRKGEVRRSKLYFLRVRIGKAASKVKEKAVNHKTTPAA